MFLHFDVLVNSHHPRQRIARIANGRLSHVCAKQDFFPVKIEILITLPIYLFICLKIKSQVGKLNVPFQIDASMTTIPWSFHVQNCRLSNLAKIILESKALNALIPSSVISDKGSKNLQSKNWQFDQNDLLC